MNWATMALDSVVGRIASFLSVPTLAQAGRYGADRAGGNALGIWGLPAGWWWVWLVLAFVLIVIGGSLATGRFWTRDDRTLASGPGTATPLETGKNYMRGFSGTLGWLVILVGIVVAGLVWWRADVGPHYAVNPPAAGHSSNMGNGNVANNGHVKG